MFGTLWLWLDAADRNTITTATSSVNVTQWSDKSGNGYNFTNVGTTYYMTTNNWYSNNNTVYSTFYTVLSNTSVTLPKNYTIFVVAGPVSDS